MPDGGAAGSKPGLVPGQDSFLGRAVRYMEQRRFAAAEATCKAVLAHDPSQVEAQQMLGLALGAQGHADAAARWLDRAARARPGRPHPAHALLGLLQDIGQTGLIAPQLHACLASAPQASSLRLALAEAQHEAGQAADALDTLRPLLLAQAPCSRTQVLAGTALADLGQFERAAAMFRAVVERDPAAAAGWTNLGAMLGIEGRFDEALAAADRAVSLAPEDRQIRLNRAMIALRAGRLAQAWDDYDARLDLPGRAPMPPDTLLRDVGQLDAKPASVLVLHDCGFGDTLHFIRHASDLAARGARVIAWMPAELASLVARVPGVAEIAPADAPPPPHDLHCHATDLPRICRVTLPTIPSAPYLFADPARVAYWRQRLGPRGGEEPTLRVGLAWAGQARPWMPGFDVLDGRRSLGLGQLAPLAGVPGATFFSLQKGVPAEQARTPPAGLELVDLTRELGDFADTAALVVNLDLVVSVDTSVAHLAGGMGARVLLLDRYDNCWRWFSDRTDSPWYPGLRILRQPRPGDWNAVVRRAASMLRDMTSASLSSGAAASARPASRTTMRRSAAPRR